MTQQELLDLLQDMSLKEKVDQMLQLSGFRLKCLHRPRVSAQSLLEGATEGFHFGAQTPYSRLQPF